MQGFPTRSEVSVQRTDTYHRSVRRTVFLSHAGMGKSITLRHLIVDSYEHYSMSTAFLLDCVDEGDLHHILTCFYAPFFQLFPIISSTLVSFVHSELSANDVLFAVLVMLSFTTIHVLSLVPFDLRRGLNRSASEILDAVCMALILLLSVAVNIVVLVFLMKTDCGNAIFNLPETTDPTCTVRDTLHCTTYPPNTWIIYGEVPAAADII